MASSLPSLLMLPPPPVPINTTSLLAAYRPAIEATVSVLKGQSTSSQLQVVIPSPSLHGHLEEPRSHIFDDAQKLLGGIYSLCCGVCAKLGVDVESGTPGSIDFRVILLDYTGQEYSTTDDAEAGSTTTGPVIDLPTFALTRRRWTYMFSVDGEEGQKLFASYLNLASQLSPSVQGHVYPVSGGLSLLQRDEQPTGETLKSSKKHNVVILGGTFDHIHAGHKLLLTALAFILQPPRKIFTTPRRIIIGITGDELLKDKKYAEYLKSWNQRQEDVVEFLLSILLFSRKSNKDSIEIFSFEEPGPNGKAVHTKLRDHSITIECVEIQDPFGPTITDQNVTALVVSAETRSGGQAVNNKRIEKGWDALEVFEIDVLDSQENEEGPSKTGTFASKISSTAIRKRKADIGRSSSL